MFDSGPDRPVSDDTGEPGVGTLVLRIVEDAKRWARAEADFYKGLASDRAGDAGVGAGLGVAIVMLVQAFLAMLLVGIVLTLAPRIGPGWATIVVSVGTLLLIAVLAGMARARLRRVARPIPKDPI